MRIHVLQHVAFEGLAAIEPLLRRRGAQISYSYLYAGAALPDAGQFDALLIMGGPMSVNDEADYPWLAPEKRLIKQCIVAGKPVLGICLGAQLIAAAMGARVYPGVHKEIGWFPIEATLAGQQDWGFPTTLPVLHWHGETFDLPASAVQLARSPACENQAFALGNRVLGLQCHLEMDAAAVASISQHCADELLAGRWIQTSQELQAIPAAEFAQAHALLEQLLARCLDTRA